MLVLQRAHYSSITSLGADHWTLSPGQLSPAGTASSLVENFATAAA